MNKNKKYVPMGVDTIDEIYEGYAINDDVESDKVILKIFNRKDDEKIKWYK